MFRSGSLPLEGRGFNEPHVSRPRTTRLRPPASQRTNRGRKRLWHFLRVGKLGVKFRRQAAIGAYLVDFVCFSHRLIVELDGPQHLEENARDYDTRRTAWLASHGFRVLRFRNQALDEDVGQVVEEIQRALREAGPAIPPLPSPPLKGEGPERKNILIETDPLTGTDAGMGAPCGLPRLVQGSEIADVEGEDSAAFGCGKGELFLVDSGVFPGLLGGQDVVPAATQIDGQPGHDVAVEVQANEERLKAGGIGHGPALPGR